MIFGFLHCNVAELLSALSSAFAVAPRPFCKLGLPCCCRGLKLSFALVVLTKPSPAVAPYLAFPTAGAKGEVVPAKLIPDGRGWGASPALQLGDIVLGLAHGAGFPGKVQSHGRVGKHFALVWRGQNPPSWAPCVQPGWTVDFTQQEAAVVIGIYSSL